MRLLLVLCCLGLASAHPTITFDDSNYANSDIMTRDVCIIGGGSSGTYSAIGLRDKGKSVVVIEREDVLGGHTNTYIVPGTNTPVDYGVVVFHNLDIVLKYFGRFNVPLAKLSSVFPSTPTPTEYIDFQTGRIVANYTPPTPTSLPIYLAQLAKYPYVKVGFDLPYPVPKDLLLTFGDFVKKYALGDMVAFLLMFVQGYGDILAQPTIYVLKSFGTDFVNDVLTGSLLTTVRQDNHEIYDKALAELGPDALLSSHVLGVSRPSNGSTIKVIVSTPSGVKLIKACKLLITIPPKLYNLAPFDLDVSERHLFAHFGNTGYYTGLLVNTGIPPNTNLVNVGTDTPYHIAQLPGLYTISATRVPGLIDVKFASVHSLPDCSGARR